MTVCIAEKPSVAGDIAKVLGASSRKEGYYEGNGYQVTWTYGHLCCLKSPEEYNADWKKWTLQQLPMIPNRFGIKLIPEAGIKKQFGIIKKLFSKADTIVNCGDAGQEGELIQRWVMQLAEVRCPVKRLWISSLTEESIRDGFRHLRDQKQYDNLYYAGIARASGDWLLGMNATRLYTLRYGGKGSILSIGRVQTPTLALLVARKKRSKPSRQNPTGSSPRSTKESRSQAQRETIPTWPKASKPWMTLWERNSLSTPRKRKPVRNPFPSSTT